MGKTGIILVQHGDFPFDFKEKQREMFESIEGMLGKLSDETRKLPRRQDDGYSCDVALLAGAVRKAGGFTHFEVGYMEFSGPTIEEALEKLENKGLTKVVFVNTPGLMMRSSHSLMDIPAILHGIAERHPGVELVYARPGVPFERLAELFARRIDSALGKPVKTSPPGTPGKERDDFGVVMIAHGDVPLEYLESSMGMAEKHLEAWPDMVRTWPRSEANDPLFYDTMKLEGLIREKGRFENFEIGNLEFASPTLEEALDKVLSRGAEEVLFIGGTGFCDRSSHTMIDIPEAIEKLQLLHPYIKMTYAYPDMKLMCDGFAGIIVDKAYEALEKGGMLL